MWSRVKIWSIFYDLVDENGLFRVTQRLRDHYVIAILHFSLEPWTQQGFYLDQSWKANRSCNQKKQNNTIFIFIILDLEIARPSD